MSLGVKSCNGFRPLSIQFTVTAQLMVDLFQSLLHAFSSEENWY